MMFPDYLLIEKAKRQGLLVSMNGVVYCDQTEQNIKLSNYFKAKVPNYSGVYKNGKAEEILTKLNDLVGGYLKFPCIGEKNYLIPITPHLYLRVLFFDYEDEQKEYQKFVVIETFVIDENATEEDVDRLIFFLSMLSQQEAFSLA